VLKLTNKIRVAAFYFLIYAITLVVKNVNKAILARGARLAENDVFGFKEIKIGGVVLIDAGDLVAINVNKPIDIE
jgi:hypothetical protein